MDYGGASFEINNARKRFTQEGQVVASLLYRYLADTTSIVIFIFMAERVYRFTF